MPIYKTQTTNNKGFTLIELLVVASLTALLMLAASSVFMTFMIGSAKIRLSQKVKVQGDLALQQIQFLLRNATEIVENDSLQTCEAGMKEIAFLSVDGSKTVLKIKPDAGIDKIASVSGSTDPATNYFLTSDLADVWNLNFNCYAGANDANYVEVSFNLSKGVLPTPGVTPTPNPESVFETFKTGVTIRN